MEYPSIEYYLSILMMMQMHICSVSIQDVYIISEALQLNMYRFRTFVYIFGYLYNKYELGTSKC